MRPSVYIIILFCCVTLVLSCTEPEVPDEPIHIKNENILRYDVSEPFVSLDPGGSDASGSNHIHPLLFSYLFVPDSNGELQPDLAVHWSYNAENHKWTINLRKGVLFHDGQVFTSKDVKYSLKTNLSFSQPSSFLLIRRIELPTDETVCIALKKNDPEFLKKIWPIEILSENIGHRAENNHPVGTGPFKFEYKNGQNRVFLSANENYFLGRPLLDGVIYFYQPDKEKSWTRLISGQTDVAAEISPKNYQMIRTYEDRFYFNHYILNAYAILLYNTHDPLFLNPDVRKAFSYAINKEYIVDNILKGYGIVAAGPMGVDTIYHTPEVLPIPYNPKKALTLLEQAGWHYNNEMKCMAENGTCFEFEMLVFKEYQIEKKVARYIKLCLNDVGIRCHIQSVPFDKLVKRYRRNNDFQAVLTEFAGAGRCPEIVRDLWSSYPDAEPLAGGFEDRDVTERFNQFSEEQDHFLKKKLMFEIDTLMHELQPGTFLYHKTAIDVMSRRFRLSDPFSLTLEGIHSLRFAELKKDNKDSRQDGFIFNLCR